MMHRLKLDDKGVISIVMAIVIPVLILGVFMIYALLEKPQQENTAHKIVYASSEAYLSRYNAYLFNQMGILANFQSDTLEPMILHYLRRNKLIETPESAEVTIDFELLNTPSVFKEAAVEASNVLIGNALIQFSVDAMDQLRFAEKVKGFNQTIEGYEKKLSAQFEKIGATQFLKNMKLCQDVQTGKKDISALEDHLKDQYKAYFETMEAMKTVLEGVKEVGNNPMTTFLESKNAQWQASEKAFVATHQDYMNTIVQLNTVLDAIEADEMSIRAIDIEIESIKRKKPINQDKLDQLMALNSEIESSIDSRYKEIHLIVSEKLAFEAESTPSLLQLFRNLVLEAEYLFFGVKIGTAELKLDEAFKHSMNDVESAYVDTLEFSNKVKVNEFYLSIFSSYDRNCPRLFDPQKRHKTFRTLKGEAEYLVTGLVKEQQSISFVRLKIVAIRSAANLATLLSDKERLTQISTATIALPQPWRSLAYGTAIAAWTGAESYSDINRLMKGEGFYFLKAKDQWALDFESLLNGTWKTKVTDQTRATTDQAASGQAATGQAATGQTATGQTASGQATTDQTKATHTVTNIMDPNFYYLDYLRLLLLMQDEQTTLLRAMDLVEAELLNISEGKTSLVNFSRGHHIALTWKPNVIFGGTSNENTSIELRNGFK